MGAPIHCQRGEDWKRPVSTVAPGRGLVEAGVGAAPQREARGGEEGAVPAHRGAPCPGGRVCGEGGNCSIGNPTRMG